MSKRTRFGYLYEQSHYTEWRANRLNVWTQWFSLRWFRDKKILELGAGEGDIGNFYAQLGAEVVCSDAQPEHVEGIIARHPSVKACIIDAEKPLPKGHWDLIIHSGLLYHMDAERIEAHIKDVCKHCDNLILETLVVDLDDPTWNKPIKEAVDRNSRLAYNGTGARFSANYIETLLDKYAQFWHRDDNPELNSFAGPGNQHIYDWEVTNTGETGVPQYRRCWYAYPN